MAFERLVWASFGLRCRKKFVFYWLNCKFATEYGRNWNKWAESINYLSWKFVIWFRSVRWDYEIFFKYGSLSEKELSRYLYLRLTQNSRFLSIFWQFYQFHQSIFDKIIDGIRRNVGDNTSYLLPKCLQYLKKKQFLLVSLTLGNCVKNSRTASELLLL